MGIDNSVPLKVIVAGRRDFSDSDYVFEQLDKALANTIKNREIEIVQGGAAGVECIAGMWAASRFYKQRVFRAKWNEHGRAAGPIRNRKMAEYGDILIAFWNGKSPGTKNMINVARELGLPTLVIKI